MEDSSLGTRLRELSLVFLKLGVIGFGGPAAHIALMEMEVVRRRALVDARGQFLDLVGATNLIPGPNSTELAIHIGRARAGVPGSAHGRSRVHPPGVLHRLRRRLGVSAYGRLPEAVALFHGVNPS